MGEKNRIPKAFHQIIQAKYGVGGFRIMEAYIDKKDYTQSEFSGTPDLREFLELGENDTVCDCYCRISATNIGELGIIFEDKDSNHRKDMHKAKKQLDRTHINLKKKNRNIDFAIICGVHVDSSFKARTNYSYPAKALFSVWNENIEVKKVSGTLKGLKG